MKFFMLTLIHGEYLTKYFNLLFPIFIKFICRLNITAPILKKASLQLLEKAHNINKTSKK